MDLNYRSLVDIWLSRLIPMELYHMCTHVPAVGTRGGLPGILPHLEIITVDDGIHHHFSGKDKNIRKGIHTLLPSECPVATQNLYRETMSSAKIAFFSMAFNSSNAFDR